MSGQLAPPTARRENARKKGKKEEEKGEKKLADRFKFSQYHSDSDSRPNYIVLNDISSRSSSRLFSAGTGQNRYRVKEKSCPFLFLSVFHQSEQGRKL